jgi:hypothetical protein
MAVKRGGGRWQTAVSGRQKAGRTFEVMGLGSGAVNLRLEIGDYVSRAKKNKKICHICHGAGKRVENTAIRG